MPSTRCQASPSAGLPRMRTSGFEVLQAAVLDVRDVAPCELELEVLGVMAGAEQHGLVVQVDALLAQLEDPIADERRLRSFVATQRELRRAPVAACRSQHLGHV